MKGLEGLEKLVKNLKNISKEQKVDFGELFSYDFMQENTNIDSINDFFEVANITVETQEDFRNLDETILNEAVLKFTRFSSWNEMSSKAGRVYFEKTMFKGLK